MVFFFLLYIHYLNVKLVNKLCKLPDEAKFLGRALTKNDKLNIWKDLHAIVILVRSLANKFQRRKCKVMQIRSLA